MGCGLCCLDVLFASSVHGYIYESVVGSRAQVTLHQESRVTFL